LTRIFIIDQAFKKLGRSKSHPRLRELAKTVRKSREGILATIELELSNSILEGLKSKIRLANHGSCGHRSPAAIVAYDLRLPLRPHD
jgi:transposase